MMQLNIDTRELKSFIEGMIREELRKYSTQPQPEVSTIEEVLTAEAAADFLDLKKNTIYRLVQQLKIPFSRRGKRLYFLKEDLIQWVKKGRVNSESEILIEVENLLSNKIGKKKIKP